MRILILGSGGREHALYLKTKESSQAEKVFVWPGNGLVPAVDRVDKEPVVDDFTQLKEFIARERIDFTIVGNETPLVAGVRDALKAWSPQHFVFGPDKFSSGLEGSKAFADAFMVEAGIAHGLSLVAHNHADAVAALMKAPLPVVVKADGLAAGKGVSIHAERESARTKLSEIFEGKIFGDSGNRVLLQQFLPGVEASLFAICNGRDALLMPVARDYKRALDGDAGDNTGGMGAYTPAMQLTQGQKIFVRKNIIEPVLKKFAYRGLLYVGLMIKSAADDDVAVVEFNCRFGDPETQSIMALIEGDLLEYLLWSDDGIEQDFPVMLDNATRFVPYRRGTVVNVVIAARGYPGTFEKNIPLSFPEPKKDLHVTGAGIAEREGKLYSSGGRIANVVAWGKDKTTARAAAYAYLAEFSSLNAAVLDKLYWRSDIAEGT